MLNLPRADHTPLRHPPLPLVVAQARFGAPVDGEISNDVTARFQVALNESGCEFTRVVPVQTNDIVFGPGVQPASASSKGFQLSPEDRSWMVTLMPDSISLETPSFESFAKQFGPLLRHVLSSTTQTISPVTLIRAGLRFVNVLRSPDGEAQWSRWVRPSLVAPHADELLTAGVVNHSQQVVFDVAPGVRSTVRTGPAKAGTEDAFLLDIDTFAEPATVWSVDGVEEWFDRLNESGVALFQTLLSPDMLTHLQQDNEEPR